MSEKDKPSTSSQVPPGTIEKQVRAAADQARPIESDEEFNAWRRGQQVALTTQNLELRKKIANWSIGIMVAQIALVNVVFVIYALTKGADLPEGVLQAWFASTVVQIVGIVLVITRYLFPEAGREAGKGR